jgi:PIN domain nuclease of toxin-antitoxin system
MRVLLDSNALIWWVTASRRLGIQAHEVIEDKRNEVVVGAGALLEMGIKRSLQKLHFPYDFEAVLRGEDFNILPISFAHLRTFETLPLHHRDPFDRLLIAQALAEGIPIATDDRVFGAYGVQIVW